MGKTPDWMVMVKMTAIESNISAFPERRKRARVNWYFPAAVHHWAGREQSACILNVSLFGCLLSSTTRLHVGEIVTLEVQVPSVTTLSIRAVVVRADEEQKNGRWQIGVRYLRPHAPLMDYVKKQLWGSTGALAI